MNNPKSDSTATAAERDFSRIPTPVQITKEQLRSLSQVHPLISAGHILFEWGLVVLAAIMCQHFWNTLLYVVIVAFIGARQHAMLILMHDGTHYRLFRNRSLNDWATELSLAWPNLIAMRSYRENHRAHHNYTNTDKDPDWIRKKDDPEWYFPQSAKMMVRMFLRDLSGIGGIGLLKLASSISSSERAPNKAFARARLAFYLVVTGVIIYVGGVKIFLLYWAIPFFTWLVFILHIRSIAEHFAIEGKSGIWQTRTTHAGILARLFIAPKNVGYHLDHHFFPSVPFHRLPQLHALLMSKNEFAHEAHITKSYAHVLFECIRPVVNAGGAVG